MAEKYHISPKTGRPNKCYATKRPCPIGGDDEHYSSKVEAKVAYETKQAKENGNFKSLSRKTTETKKSDSLPNYYNGPTPKKVSKTQPANREVMVDYCTSCGFAAEGLSNVSNQGYSDCCGKPYDSEKVTKILPASYEITFDNKKDVDNLFNTQRFWGTYEIKVDKNFNKEYKAVGRFSQDKERIEYSKHYNYTVNREFVGEIQPDRIQKLSEGIYKTSFADPREADVFAERNNLEIDWDSEESSSFREYTVLMKEGK